MPFQDVNPPYLVFAKYLRFYAAINRRLDQQDDSLRLMWKRMKGNGKLPIDD